MWTARERFLAVVGGERADRAPVAAWRHFVPEEGTAAGLAAATIAFQRAHGWDFVKLNPRATYYAEAWGNRYDATAYEGVVPRLVHHVIRRPEDLFALEPVPVDGGPFGEQLEALRLVRQGLGPEPVILQTVFSPLAVLEYLAGHRTPAGRRPALRAESPLPALIAAAPEGVHRALAVLVETLAEYGRRARQAGADGFFFAALGLARDGYLTDEEWAAFARRYDVLLLEALGGVRVVHTCGPAAHPERFADYPAEVLHWASRAPGNPPLSGARAWSGGKAVMGGVDETLFAEDAGLPAIRAQAREALAALAEEPFVLAPECGVPTAARPSHLRALKAAAEEP